MRLSKGFYVGSMVAGPVVGAGLLVMGFILGGVGAGMSQAGSRPAAEAGGAAFLGAAGFWFLAVVSLGLGAIYSIVVYYVLLYKAWSAIQDGHARTTPAAAVGLMFVPLFNLYWQFQVIWGFAVDYNRYIERHRLGVARLPDGLFLTANILMCGMVIPFLNLLVALVLFWIQLAIVAKICDGVNAIAGKVTTVAAVPVS